MTLAELIQSVQNSQKGSMSEPHEMYGLRVALIDGLLVTTVDVVRVDGEYVILLSDK